jgi:NAD(P)-dependent dehydrogenase (short-subunit alcohol dehydrogenase family)
MVVPGLHSMFLGLDVSLAKDDGALHEAIDFAVLSLTERFRMVRIGISGPGLSGTLQTMSRLPPARQPGIGRVIDAVNGQEFQNSVALVVGGSRGLGEVAAKLIAAGGGEVVITYWRGEKDAQSVASEITAAGLRCKAVRFDIQESSSSQLEALNVTPTHLYYFATPPIFQRKSGVFDAARFAEFNTYYVKGFFDVVTSCAALSRDALRVFYPSSSAIDSRPANMTEYTMSKAAAETLCADLTKFVPGIHVLTRRLPRLATDQTISVVQAKTADSVDVMLAIIREMHGDRLETRNG